MPSQQYPACLSLSMADSRRPRPSAPYEDVLRRTDALVSQGDIHSALEPLLEVSREYTAGRSDFQITRLRPKLPTEDRGARQSVGATNAQRIPTQSLLFERDGPRCRTVLTAVAPNRSG